MLGAPSEWAKSEGLSGSVTACMRILSGPTKSTERPSSCIKIWVVVKFMVPFWVLSRIRHLARRGA